MTDREKAIKGLECCRNGFCFACPYNDGIDESTDCKQRWADDALALLKAQEPCEDWISRKQLKDEIQYYIDEAGWGEEVNKVLGWCLEFIDNQKAVKWDG